MIETYYQRDFPYPFAFLSDTHNTDPEPILQSLDRNRPEMIVISGDFTKGELSEHAVSKMAESENSLTLFRGCAGIAPTFVSMGNHERSLVPQDLDVIAKTGAVILDNTWAEYKKVFIGGLSSAYFTEYKKIREAGGTPRSRRPYILKVPPEPELSWLESFQNLPGKKILLCHHPEYYHKYLLNRDIDLILSGHCHGGQWRYYSLIRREWRGVYAPNQGFFPSLTAGIHEDRLVISRGLANTAPVPRIYNPTELIYFIPSEPRNNIGGHAFS